MKNFNSIIESYKAAGFSIDGNRVSFKNDIGVSIIDFLDAKSSCTKVTSKRGKSFVSRKFDNTHCVIYRNPSEKDVLFATVEPISRF
jgi:hypothetical protein